MAAASLFWDANVAAVTDAVKKRFHQKEIQAFPNCYFAFSVWYQSGKICLDQAVHAASAQFPPHVLLHKARRSKIVNRAVVMRVDNLRRAAVFFQFYRLVIEVARLRVVLIILDLMRTGTVVVKR